MSSSESTEANPNLVSVFTASDATTLPVVEGLLREEGIPFWAKREGLQDLLAWGRLGSGHNLIVGPVEILVHPDDVERAQALLAGSAGSDGFDRPDVAGPVPEELA